MRIPLRRRQIGPFFFFFMRLVYGNLTPVVLGASSLSEGSTGAKRERILMDNSPITGSPRRVPNYRLRNGNLVDNAGWGTTGAVKISRKNIARAPRRRRSCQMTKEICSTVFPRSLAYQAFTQHRPHQHPNDSDEGAASSA